MVLAIVAEVRGNRDIEAFGRRIGPSTVRLAVAVVAMSALVIGLSTATLLLLTNLPLSEALLRSIVRSGLSVCLPASPVPSRIQEKFCCPC